MVPTVVASIGIVGALDVREVDDAAVVVVVSRFVLRTCRPAAVDEVAVDAVVEEEEGKEVLASVE